MEVEVQTSRVNHGTAKKPHDFPSTYQTLKSEPQRIANLEANIRSLSRAATSLKATIDATAKGALNSSSLGRKINAANKEAERVRSYVKSGTYDETENRYRL